MARQPERTTDLFDGPSEMHARMRAFDWSSSAIGPVESWPQSLKVVVRTLLASRYPMVMTWGPNFTQFYNDAYSRLIGDKHPAALGLDIRITLAEGWGTLGPIIAEVMATGQASWLPALLLLLDRSGYREEAYFDVSHAPAEDDSGRIVGMLAVCSEVTQQVLADRRLRLLRDLAFRASQTRSLDTACEDITAAVAEHPLDVPFALLYLPDASGRRLTLVAGTGLEAGGPLSPAVVDLDTEDTAWPLERAAGETVLIDDLPDAAGLRGGPWAEPVRTALALPIATGGQGAPQGVLVAAISPSRALDEGYRSFFALLAGQVSAAVRNALAYQEERRRAEELALLDRAKTAFFSNVSHEFRTPLTLLLGPVADLLARAEQRPPQDVELLGIIQRNGLRLLKLVNTLLDFSRIEASRASALYQPTDLAALTADLASSFRSTIERAGLRYTVDCPPLSQPVYVDHDMWEKIVLNLLSNAFKFTFAGEIAVTLREVDGAAELAVRDTGAGIPETDQGQIFQRFHRVRGARGRTHEGTGIGLALVQELVRLHGGTIDVASEPGRGTTFTVSIPLGSAHLPQDRISAARGLERTTLGSDAFVAEASRWLPDSPADPREDDVPDFAPSPSGPEAARIVLADDNADMRAYVKQLLGGRWQVEVAGDGI
ncbi:MAG TPA: GAF domain-containing sensor histidine kinase, partial [Roseiflexaceae bacterium]|nr:GAF domain-containing sensor histidine kinase [Roseiflexaceae bacterium]